MSEVYLSTAYARILFRHLKLDQQSGEPFFEGTSVNYDTLMKLDTQVSYQDQERLFVNALGLAKAPGLGLSVGSHLHLSAHGPLGIAAFSSPDLRQALEVFIRYTSTRAQFVDISSCQTAQHLCLHVTPTLPLGKLECFLMESVMSAIYVAITFFTADKAFDGYVGFSYPVPPYAALYEEAFHIPVNFDCKHNLVAVPLDILDTPSPVPDKQMHESALAQCESLLASLKQNRSTLSDKVREILQNNPGKLWGQAIMADQLNMSSRTLIRKLAEEGEKYQDIQDTVVFNLAKQYLKNPSLSVDAIAQLLGYSDASSFRRGFKRYWGQTPAAYRLRL